MTMRKGINENTLINTPTEQNSFKCRNYLGIAAMDIRNKDLNHLIQRAFES